MAKQGRPQITRFAWLSIAAALATIVLKVGAFVVTGSVGLLSDAAESLVNLIGAGVALAMLTVAARPPDDEHAYGHGKAEYFSSGVEGALIVVAALSIASAAILRLLNPQPISYVAFGLIIAGIATAVNFGVSIVLQRAGEQHDSITLEADAQHLFTDVLTSIGVIVGVGAVALTGWNWLDPAIALLVAANILWTGWRLARRSVLGLMDTALPDKELEKINSVLAKYREHGVVFHAIRSRQAGARRFVSMHVLVPADWTVQRGHQLLESIEGDIRKVLPTITVFTHLEPISDPASYDDTKLDRPKETEKEETEKAAAPAS